MSNDQYGSIIIVRSSAPKGSGGLIIRGLTGADTSLLHRWWNNPDVMTHVGFPNGLNLSRIKVEKIVAASTGSDTEFRAERRFIIETVKPAMPIGELNYSGWDKVNGKVSIGIKICEQNALRKGYASAALYGFISYVFEHLAVHKIELDTLARNQAARRLYEKIGFSMTGIIPNGFREEATGAYEDVVLFEILRSSWPSVFQRKLGDKRGE